MQIIFSEINGKRYVIIDTILNEKTATGIFCLYPSFADAEVTIKPLFGKCTRVEMPVYLAETEFFVNSLYQIWQAENEG
jgi:hypothetical protein